MSSYNTTVSLLAQAQAVGRVLVVPMGEVDFVSFTETSAIGTRDLAGCSVVIIASQHGAILAHIPPRPNTDVLDVHAGDRNVQRIMDNVDRRYSRWKNCFPSSDTYAVFAVYQGSVALPDQKKIIEENIERMGLRSFNSILYITPRDPLNLGHGTALVDSQGRVGKKPHVYVEDRLVSAEQPSQQLVPQQEEPQSQQSNTGWIWDTTCMRYYMYQNGQVIYAPETS